MEQGRGQKLAPSERPEALAGCRVERVTLGASDRKGMLPGSSGFALRSKTADAPIDQANPRVSQQGKEASRNTGCAFMRDQLSGLLKTTEVSADRW